MKLTEIVRTGLNRFETVRVRSALNPLLWLSGITTTLAFGTVVALAAGGVTDVAILSGLIAFAAVPLFATVVAYFVLMVRDPGSNPRNTGSSSARFRS